ncbi:MAG: hypothetical protein ACOY71_12100 [Gemmatimonadota bacterium]
MAWRVLELGDTLWHVSCVAERRANAVAYELVLGFRRNPDGLSFWAAYPLSSVSKANLFKEAESIPDDRLAALIAQHLS